MERFGIRSLRFICVALVIGLLALCAGCGGDSGNTSSKGTSSSSTQQAKQKTYADADINVLLSEAKDNAAAANKNYKGKDVKIIGGHVKNIDSDVKYVTVDGTAAQFTMISIRCDVDQKNQELKDKILTLKKEQNVTVYGTISDVGDIMGYKLKLDNIEPAQ